MSIRLIMATTLALALGGWGCAGDTGGASSALSAEDGQGDECISDADCGDPALECDDGFCKPHDGDDGDDEGDCDDGDVDDGDDHDGDHDGDGEAEDDDGHEGEGDGDQPGYECSVDEDCGDPALVCDDGTCVPAPADPSENPA